MMVDVETTQFLFNVFPEIGFQIVVAALIFLPILGLTAWFDPLRIRRVVALAGFVLCFAVLAGLSLLSSLDREDEFFDRNFVSKFARSTAAAVIDLTTGQLLEFDARAAGRLDPAAAEPECPTDQKRPHIFLVLDELSFDATLMPGIKVPANYRNHFRSFDGKERRLVVEGAGGPTWYTEYNVLTGLSSRSYGRFAEGVTRIAAGRVNRGLPHVLRHCGYRTFSAYPQPGAFLNARGFQTSAGIERFLQAQDIGSRERNTDDFYYDFALRTFSWERGNGPVFYFLYTVANHFPWNFTFRPDLTPGFKGFGNRPDVDEYVRRQIMSAQYYAEFLAKLRSQFPDELIPDRSIWRSSAGLCPPVHQSEAGAGGSGRAYPSVRSTILHVLLCHRCHQLHARGSVIRPRHARCAASSACGAASRGYSSRQLLCRTEENSATMSRSVLSLQQRCRSPAI